MSLSERIDFLDHLWCITILRAEQSPSRGVQLCSLAKGLSRLGFLAWLFTATHVEMEGHDKLAWVFRCSLPLWLREKAETTGGGALSLLGEGFPGTSNWDGTPITYKSPLT